MLSQFFGRESNNFFLYCCPLAFSELRIPVDLQRYFVVVAGPESNFAKKANIYNGFKSCDCSGVHPGGLQAQMLYSRHGFKYATASSCSA